MTPIEQAANEIVAKYMNLLLPKGFESWSGIYKYTAIQCAITEVDECIKLLNKLRKPEYTVFVLKYTSFNNDTTVKEQCEHCDGYELIEYYQQILTHLKTM